MAVNTWTGETDGDWGTATNFVADTAPGTGDKGLVPADATVAIDGGAYEAVMDKFEVAEGCDVAMGSRAAAVTTPLSLDFSSETNATVELAGTGQTYLKVKEAKKVKVNKAGSAPGTGQFALHLTSESTTNETGLDIEADSNESIGVAPFPDDTAEFHPIKVNGGDVTIGSVTKKDGSTAFDLTVVKGTVVNSSPVGTLKQYAGKVTHNAGVVAALSVYGGRFIYDSTRTLTQGYVHKGAVLDITEACTITNLTAYAGATINDANGLATWTNAIAFPDGIESVTLVLGKGRKATIADI